jgi:hypothetical protein
VLSGLFLPEIFENRGSWWSFPGLTVFLDLLSKFGPLSFEHNRFGGTDHKVTLSIFCSFLNLNGPFDLLGKGDRRSRRVHSTFSVDWSFVVFDPDCSPRTVHPTYK